MAKIFIILILLSTSAYAEETLFQKSVSHKTGYHETCMPHDKHVTERQKLDNYLNVALAEQEKSK